MLKWRLGTVGMRAIVDSYIAIAKGKGDRVTPAIQLAAIENIFNRLEGKPRQMLIESHTKEDPLVELLLETYGSENQLPTGTSVRRLTEATVREITSEEAES